MKTYLGKTKPKDKIEIRLDGEVVLSVELKRVTRAGALIAVSRPEKCTVHHIKSQKTKKGGA